MSVYAWLVVLVLLAALLLKGNTAQSKKFIVIAFVLLTVVCGMRDAYSVGNDSASSYLHYYQDMEDTDWSEISGKDGEFYNIGFSYLMKAVYDLTGGDYQMFIFIVSAFVMFAYMHLIKRYSPSPLQSVLYFFGLLFYLFAFNALKQSIAMAVLLFAFDAIMDRKPVKFLLLVGIAAMFHYPALAFLPAYPIARIKVNRGYLVILAAILALTYVFRDQLLNFMLDSYGGEDIKVTLSGVKFLKNKVVIMIMIVVAALALRPITEGDEVYSVLLKFMGIAIVFQTFSGYDNIFERLADYYFHFSIIFIPLVFDLKFGKKQLFEPKLNRLLKKSATVVFCAFAIWRFISTAEADPNLSPYLFFFQG